MRDCVILINDRLVSLTHNSLLLIQPPTCPQSRSPTFIRVLVRVLGDVGTVEKVLGIDKTLTFAFWKIWLPPNLITDWINLSRLRRFGLKSTHTTKSSWEFLLLSWRLSRWHLYCPEFLQTVIRSLDTRVQCFKTTSLLGDRCGNRASPEMSFPDMSGTTSTDEEETIDVPVGVVSWCVRGKLPYQYYRNGYGYFMKNILSSLDPVLKFLELSLSTMPPTLSWVWVPRFLVLKLNSWQNLSCTQVNSL